jgi:excisionase family DNA binding protein
MTIFIMSDDVLADRMGVPVDELRRLRSLAQVPRVALTREEAGRACGVSADTIARHIKSGRLRAKRTSGEGAGNYLISPDALQRWFDELPDA